MKLLALGSYLTFVWLIIDKAVRMSLRTLVLDVRRPVRAG